MTSYKNAGPRPPIMDGTPPPPHWRVPRVVWDRPPWNRWAFQHVREILPTVPVRRAIRPVPLSHDPLPVEAVAFTAGDGNGTTVGQLLEDTYTDGFIVLIGGRVVTELYFNGMRPETLHLLQSVSKSVVSTVAGILIGRGLLKPQKLITDYLPELEATAWKGATLGHVLDMTSGVKFNEDYTAPDSDIARTDVASGWKPAPEGADPACWPGCIWDQILSLTETEAAHGARFEYRSIETDVLAHAMERVSGKRLARLVSDEIWSRIGTEEDGCFTVDPAGYALADGGFNATLRDMARFGLLLLNRGRTGNEQIIPEAWIDDIRSGTHGRFNDYGRQYFPNGCYRNMFWIEDKARATVLCLGVFGQLVMIAPEHEMVAVKLSSFPDFTNPDFTTDTLRALHAIAGAFAAT
jgi:CubicO group peptidase (beta-lactamase class C family)